MSISPSEMALGMIVVSFLGFVAYKLKTIDGYGLLAGVVIGVTLLIGRGWPWLILMMVFFTVSAVSTSFRYEYKRSLGFGQEKGGARGWRNVFANGGVAAAVSLLAAIWPDASIFPALFLGAMATAASDTVATEIGLLSRSRPRLITNLRKKVGVGTSGGVSLLGEVMVVASGLLIGLLAILFEFRLSSVEVVLASLLGGFAGSNFDSLLGATLQGMNRCVVCGVVTEGGVHHDKSTVSFRGVKIIGNNSVNLISTLVGALVAAVLLYVI